MINNGYNAITTGSNMTIKGHIKGPNMSITDHNTTITDQNTTITGPAIIMTYSP